MIKYVAFDLDGTLLNDNKEVVASSLKAIQQLKFKGICPIIASGRSPDRTKMISDLLNIHAVVALNGSYVEYEHKIICDDYLTKQHLSEIIPVLKKFNGFLILEFNNQIFAITDNHTSLLLEGEFIQRFSKFTCTTIDELQSILKKAKVFAYINKNMHQNLEQELSNYTFRFFQNNLASISFKGVSKASGLQKICPKEELLCFGDQVNDLEMIQYAKIGVAMGNATQQLKDASDYICDDNNSDAIFETLKHFKII